MTRRRGHLDSGYLPYSSSQTLVFCPNRNLMLAFSRRRFRETKIIYRYVLHVSVIHPHSSQIVETTGPERTTSPTFPPSSSVRIRPDATSRFQITTVLLSWFPTANMSPAAFSEN